MKMILSAALGNLSAATIVAPLIFAYVLGW